MLILGIESSCDETSLAFLKSDLRTSNSFHDRLNNLEVLSSVISTQVEIHRQYGGVVPEIGARSHADQIHYLFLKILKEAQGIVGDESGIAGRDLDFLGSLDQIAVTSEPGLAAGLRVGLEFAKILQFFIYQKTGNFVEIVKVNHLKGHVLSCFYNENDEVIKRGDGEIFPHLHLLVSGGNSQTILLESPEKWKIVGQTLDDAVGECLDKIGRMLGFPYPGGVFLAKVAGLESGNYFDFPVGMKNSDRFDYSFSGLKTAVRYFLEKSDVEGYKFEKLLDESEIEVLQGGSDLSDKLDFIKKVSVSVQTVAMKQLINQFKKAVSSFKPESIGVSGGVSANEFLRGEMFDLFDHQRVFMPRKELTGDNAIMIGLTAFE